MYKICYVILYVTKNKALESHKQIENLSNNICICIIYIYLKSPQQKKEKKLKEAVSQVEDL